MVHPSVTLYQNLKTKTVLVRLLTMHPIGAATEIREIAQIPEAELRSRLVPEVLAALDAFGKEPYNDEASRALVLDAKARRQHSHVDITREEDGAITVLPTRRTRGGSIGYDEDVVRVEAGEGVERLCAAIMDALEKAGTPKFHKSISRTRSG